MKIKKTIAALMALSLTYVPMQPGYVYDPGSITAFAEEQSDETAATVRAEDDSHEPETAYVETTMNVIPPVTTTVPVTTGETQIYTTLVGNSKLTIEKMPDKIIYKKGEKLDLSGLVLKFSNDYTEYTYTDDDISDEFNISTEFDSSKPGRYIVHISDKYNPLFASFSVRVLAADRPDNYVSSVAFDDTTGTITLKGNVAVDDVIDFSENSAVKKIVAEKGTVFPADCSGMFRKFTASSIDLSNADTSNVTNMSEMFCDFTGCESIDLSGFDTSKVTDMSSMFEGCTASSIDVSGFDTSSVTDMSGMFSLCGNIESIATGRFDTSKVTDMNGIFNCCFNLKSVDISSFDTSNVTNMAYMFNCCSSLVSIDLSGLDTSKVTDMKHMFAWCECIAALDLSRFDTSKVTDMEDMFDGDESLAVLDLSTFDTSNVTNFEGMFANCGSLRSIYVDKFDVSKAEKTEDMFYGCQSLAGGNGTIWDPEKRGIIYARIDEKDAPGYFTKKTADTVITPPEVGTVTYDEETDTLTLKGNIVPAHVKRYRNAGTIIAEEGCVLPENCDLMFEQFNASKIDLSKADSSKVRTMRNMFFYCNNIKSLDLSGLDTSNVTDMREMFGCCFALESIDLSGLDTSKVIDMSGMFRGTALKKIDLGKLNTSNVTDMSYMFDDCNKLETVVLKGLDTSKVKKMSNIFRSCTSLRSVDLSGIDTSSVINMSGMFGWCESLEKLDLSGFDTSNAEDMTSMFSYCSELKTLDVSGFNTEKVKDMSGMFSGCKLLQSLDLSSFATPDVVSLSKMFEGCSSLKSVDISKFITSKVVDMSGMFNGCKNLEKIDLTGFDTSDVGNMDWMFNECSSLTELDLSSFDTSGVGNMEYMFDGDLFLETIWVNNFDMSKAENTTSMFGHCVNLTGGNGTKWDRTKNDSVYARIDEEGKPGFFTKKAASAEPAKNDTKIVYGDANCNGIVDMGDAVLIMQSISNPSKYDENGTENGHITAAGKKNADCSDIGDGVTNKDALAIQKYLLRLIDKLPE
ncbi:MAG: BspA family leucine-rich repeat surface protein [Ruminococcus flavefaciens]